MNDKKILMNVRSWLDDEVLNYDEAINTDSFDPIVTQTFKVRAEVAQRLIDYIAELEEEDYRAWII